MRWTYISTLQTKTSVGAWIKMPLGTEVGLGPVHIVLDGNPAPPKKKGGIAAPTFRPMPIVAKRSPISATAELLSQLLKGGIAPCLLNYGSGCS